MNNRRLYSPSYVKEILDAYGFSPSKGLGQNFLIDGNFLRKISQEGQITKEDYILEIGPGIGTLTEELALKGKRVVAVELDKNLLPILDKTLQRYENVEIVHGDILEIDIKKIIDERLAGGPIKVIANLPYYVTTPIIARLIEEGLKIESIILMIQKEVAQRITSPPGNKQYGSLSVFVNFYTQAEILATVPRTVFLPQPKVDSAIIRLTIRKELPQVDRRLFFQLVRTAFSKRRKTLLNSLVPNPWDLDKDEIKGILKAINIPQEIRAENLKIEDFVQISKTLSSLDIY